MTGQDALSETLFKVVSQIFDEPRPETRLLVESRVPTPNFLITELGRFINERPGQVEALRLHDSRVPDSGNRAFRLVRDGWSLRISNAERSLPCFADICRPIRELVPTAGDVRANIYITPRDAEPAFAVHHDAADVFIVQLLGEKRWHVWEQTVRDPIWRMRASLHRANRPGETIIDDVLTPGDVLFIRRGDPHEAVAVQGLSIHMTMAIERLTGMDVLQYVVDRLSSHPLFRESTPWRLGENPSDHKWVDELLRSAVAALGDVDAATVVDGLIAKKTTDTHRGRGSFGNLISELADRASTQSLTPDTRVWLVHPYMRVERGAESVVAGGMALSGSPEDQDLAFAVLREAPNPIAISELQDRLDAEPADVLRVIALLIEAELLDLDQVAGVDGEE